MKIALNIGHTPNYATVEVGPVTLHFSYQTVIAFSTGETPLTVRENDWGPTTGKHLNRVDGGSADAKARRLPSLAFTQALRAALATYNLEV